MARKVLQDLDFNSVAKISNLPTPTASADAATKGYVDSQIEGLAWKDSVRVSAPSNVNTLSPGASIDGVSLVSGDRVLLANQTLPVQNGVYVWNGAAVAMARAFDAQTGNDLEQAIASVEEGTSAGVSFRQTSVNFTIDVGAVAWTSFGTAAPSASTSTAGIIAIATQAEADAGSVSNKAVVPSTLASWGSRARQIAANIGDAAATQFDVTHNWGTNDVTVEVFRNSSPFDTILCDVSRPSTNAVRLNFAAAPTLNQFRVTLRTGGTS